MSLLAALRHAKSDHWIDALWWLILSSIGGLLPIWGLGFFLVMFSQSVTLSVFTSNGEFALYSAAIVSGAIYVITKEDARRILRGVRDALSGKGKWQGVKGAFPGQRFFLAVFLLIVMVAIFIFTGATFGKLPGVQLTINDSLLQWLSLLLFLTSTVISYVITVIDNAAFAPSEEDFGNMWRQPADELNSQFDALRKAK